MNFLEKIFSLRNEKKHKIICIFGIKLKIKSKYLELKSDLKKLKEILAQKEVSAGNSDTDNPAYVFPHKFLTPSYALAAKEINSLEEYYQDVDNLTKGLDEESLNNFNMIYNKILLSEHNQKIPVYEFYSPHELDEIRKSKLIKYHIKKVGDHWEYKNYKLPMERFDYAIFEKKQCIPHLKTFNRIGNKTIIDAGGFTGDSALIMREFTDAPIITFEPIKKHYDFCCKTRELNNISNYTVENAALGSKNETMKIFYNIDIPGASNLIKPNANCECEEQECNIITLDSYVKDHNLSVGLIKTDVEGFEQELLNGAIETIKSQKPILLISIYHNYHDFFKIKPWLESLDLGYKFNIVKDMDEVYQNDVYLIAEVY